MRHSASMSEVIATVLKIMHLYMESSGDRSLKEEQYLDYMLWYPVSRPNNEYLWPLLLTWFNFNPSMDK